MTRYDNKAFRRSGVQEFRRVARLAWGGACLLASLLTLGPSHSAAQIIPPPTGAYKWSGAHPTSIAWSVGQNWVGNAVPPSATDLLFANVRPGREENAHNNYSNRSVRSLWFDAGTFYKLTGGVLTLGQGLANNAHLITVNDYWWSAQSEVNINNNIQFAPGGGYRLRIENYAQGGLRLGGSISMGKDLTVSGRGATHFAGALSGYDEIHTEGTPGYNLDNTAHLVLSGNNQNWDSLLAVHPQSLLFLKANNTLTSSGDNHVYTTNNGSRGGSLSFRSHSSLNYSQEHYVYAGGRGAVRQEGQRPVGAIYNDGGDNYFSGNITMRRDTWFGSRGDLKGSLTLRGKITESGGARAFTKVGRGLITLIGTQNTWSGSTTLQNGVLRISTPSNLSKTSNLVFDNGILELGGTTASWNFSLGSTASLIQWDSPIAPVGDPYLHGRGGFSAYGGDKTVTLNSGNDLTWGPAGHTPGFVQNGGWLLLSSRYADSAITLANKIVLTPVNNIVAVGGQVPGYHIHVDRGLNTNAYAVLAGGIKTVGTPSRRQTLSITKHGPGLLRVENSEASSVPPWVIGEGALLNIPAGNSGYVQPITLNGGVAGIDRQLTLNLGTTGVDRYSWSGDGGFAAYSRGEYNKDHYIYGSETLTWGSTTRFVGHRKKLMFGHYTADGTVHWMPNINLNNSASERTIRVERGRDYERADVAFGGIVTGSDNGTLQITGNGRMDLNSQSSLSKTINIRGAELRLGGGKITGTGKFISLTHGGTLMIDNHKGTKGNDRMASDTAIDLNASHLRHHGGAYTRDPTPANRNDTLSVVGILLSGGSNIIDVSNFENYAAYAQIPTYTSITANYFLQDNFSTLDLKTNREFTTSQVNAQVHFRVTNGSNISQNAIGVSPGAKIIPWATVNGSSWATPVAGAGGTYLRALASSEYHTDANANTWQAQHNIYRTNSTSTVAANKAINSLNFGNATLNLQGNLTINSGGILTTYRATIQGTGNLQTASQRPLYLHVGRTPLPRETNDLIMPLPSNLTIGGSVAISVNNVVKTGVGSLILTSSGIHTIQSLRIHAGMVDLRQGSIKTNHITIGDGSSHASADILKLPANRWEPLMASGRAAVGPPPLHPSITLHGTPYGPGAVYGVDGAVLRMGGNTKQHLRTLTILDRGTIDWVGGEVGLANILWIDTLSFSDSSARLFMRNWHEFEDILLVRKINGGTAPPSWLQQIVFEGYEEYPVLWHPYDNNYFHVTPFQHLNEPEPETYGAILGGLGLTLVLWRKRQKKRQPAARK